MLGLFLQEKAGILLDGFLMFSWGITGEAALVGCIPLLE